jgi:hypothetical protein
MVAPVVVLKLAKRINDVIAFAQHVVLSMQGNADLPGPPLTPGRGYRFGARAHTSTGIGDWGDPVVFLAS